MINCTEQKATISKRTTIKKEESETFNNLFEFLRPKKTILPSQQNIFPPNNDYNTQSSYQTQPQPIQQTFPIVNKNINNETLSRIESNQENKLKDSVEVMEINPTPRTNENEIQNDPPRQNNFQQMIKDSEKQSTNTNHKKPKPISVLSGIQSTSMSGIEKLVDELISDESSISSACGSNEMVQILVDFALLE